MGLFSEIGDAFGDAAGFVLDPLDIVDTGGIKSAVGDITGRNAEDALAADAQNQASALRQIIELLRPSVEAGQAQLGPLSQSATLEGFGSQIGDILRSDGIQPLINERQNAATAALSQAGLRRSGAAAREAARIPTETAFDIEGELNRRRQSLANIGQSGINQTAGITGQIGSILSAGTQGGLGARAAGTQNILSLLMGGLGALSDVSLKSSIKKLSDIGDLSLYEWKWNDLARSKFGFVGSSTGFIAQEVKEKYPHHVNMRDGLLSINYDNLLEEIAGGH